MASTPIAFIQYNCYQPKIEHLSCWHFHNYYFIASKLLAYCALPVKNYVNISCISCIELDMFVISPNSVNVCT